MPLADLYDPCSSSIPSSQVAASRPHAPPPPPRARAAPRCVWRLSPCRRRFRRPEWGRSVWRPLETEEHFDCFTKIRHRLSPSRCPELQFTLEDLLQVFLAEDGAARVGRVGHDETRRPLVYQTLQVLEVGLPRPLWLQARERLGHLQG